MGFQFGSSAPSDLNACWEHLLATHPLDRARAAIGWLRAAHLSKYNAFDPSSPVPHAPCVLAIDQTKGDASIAHGGTSATNFQEMRFYAQQENPGAQIVIESHREIQSGHFSAPDARGRITLLTDPVSPWTLFVGATAVYTVTSQRHRSCPCGLIALSTSRPVQPLHRQTTRAAGQLRLGLALTRPDVHCIRPDRARFT